MAAAKPPLPSWPTDALEPVTSGSIPHNRPSLPPKGESSPSGQAEDFWVLSDAFSTSQLPECGPGPGGARVAGERLGGELGGWAVGGVEHAEHPQRR